MAYSEMLNRLCDGEPGDLGKKEEEGGELVGEKAQKTCPMHRF